MEYFRFDARALALCCMTSSADRVLIGLESSGPGGAETMVATLAEALRDRGKRSIIVSDRHGWLTERAASSGIPVWIEPQRPGLDFRWIVRLGLRMRRSGIDVFHSHEFSMNVFGGAAALLAGIRHVATIHGHAYVADRSRRRLAYRWLHRVNVPIVAVSDDLRCYLSKRLGVAPEDLVRIHNGIRLPVAPPGDVSARAELRRSARVRLGLPLDGVLLLCIGNLYPVKDHASAIRALPELPGVRLAIAGRGKEESTLRRLAKELGVEEQLLLLGLRNDIDLLLSAANVFVHPSRSEGLPLAVLEAMSHGVPIVATRVGGIPEAVMDRESGLLVPANDPMALKLAVSKILESDEHALRLGLAARTRAEREFSVGTMTDRYIDLYGR